jgi:uncharacterized protein
MSRDRNERTEIAILARAPVPGQAKTRLIPVLGERGAAVLQARLIERTVQMAVAVGPVTLWATPDASHVSFANAAARYGVVLAAQPAGDLGQRIFAALSAAQGSCLAIGTDCPGLDAEHLYTCADILRAGADAVVIPVEDGGYALIGTRQPQPLLFTDMPWGTDQVMDATRERMNELGLTWREPFRLWDLDVPADLDRLRRERMGHLLA